MPLQLSEGSRLVTRAHQGEQAAVPGHLLAGVAALTLDRSERESQVRGQHVGTCDEPAVVEQRDQGGVELQVRVRRDQWGVAACRGGGVDASCLRTVRDDDVVGEVFSIVWPLPRFGGV